MAGGQTIDTSHAIVTQAAQRLHWEVRDAKGKVGAEAVNLGRLLAEMQDSRAYSALGFATFEEYLASDEVAISRSTAYRFINVSRTYKPVAHGRHWHRNMDIQKLDILSRLIDEDTDPAQIEALVEQAAEMPREELRAAVNEEARRRGGLPPEERDAPVRLVRQDQPAAMPAAAAAGVQRFIDDLATDPEYRAAVLQQGFAAFAHLLERAAGESRKFREAVPPAEMARALSPQDLERHAKRYEREVKPLLAWYEAAVTVAPVATVTRVK